MNDLYTEQILNMIVHRSYLKSKSEWIYCNDFMKVKNRVYIHVPICTCTYNKFTLKAKLLFPVVQNLFQAIGFYIYSIPMNRKSVSQYSGQLLRLEDCCQSIETSICDFIGPSVAPVNDPVQQPAGVGVKVQQQHHCLLGQLVDLSIKSTGTLNSQTKLTHLSMSSLGLSLCC